jgi:hypothetical protein
MLHPPDEVMMMNSARAKESVLTILVCLGLTTSASVAGTAQSVNSTPAQSLANARVDSIDIEHGSVVLTDCPPEQQTGQAANRCSGRNLSVAVSSDTKPKLKMIHVGDHVSVSFQTDKMDTVSAISLRSQPVSPFWRLMTMVLAFLATFLLASMVTGGHPLRLIVGQDNRYSNSQFQMALWFSILISTYAALVVLRVSTSGWDFWGGVDIPAHLFALSGASALTFGAAKGITTSKVQAAQSGGAPDPKPAAKAPRFLLDLISNDSGGFDLGDFQMIVITFLAVAMYLISFFQFLGSIESLKAVSLPDVDSTILAAFGLGQGAYLTKKAGGSLGTS